MNFRLLNHAMPFSSTDSQTILFLAANPKDTGRLRLDQELRDIAEGLQRAQKRDQFNLEQRLAVRTRDIQRAMLDVSPQIIHFSGHGEGEAGLMFEDEIGNAKFVDGAALAGLFELFADQITCIVLNGCYSDVQAKAIGQHIPYVIGMNQAIGDRAAIAFAVGFYDALGAGRPIEFAYKLGCAAIRMEGLAENLTPVLLKQSASGDATVQPKPYESTPPMPRPPAPVANEPIEVFISYSHKDEDLKDDLYIHLANLTRQNKIKPWQDRAIEAGTEWDAEIKARLESAGIILLLITPRFIASEYCFDKEMQRAMERHAAGTARVIPIIMKPCDWQDTAFSKLQVLPKDAKPVTSWSDGDEALLDVVKGIRRAVDSLASGTRQVNKAPSLSTTQSVMVSNSISLSDRRSDSEKAVLLQLTVEQRKALRVALMAAFPGQPQLELMVEDELEESLNRITQGQSSYELAVRDLVKWAEAEGRLAQLISAAVNANPGNSCLKNFSRQFQKENPIPGNSHTIEVISFTELENLLKIGNWKEADQKTEMFLSQLAGYKENSSIRIEDIKKISCDDLYVLDQLWIEFSKGHFGFSVQEKIWYQSREDYNQFYTLVGWYFNRQWKSYNELTFNLVAPEGHLPTLWTSTKVLSGFRGYFFLHTKQCFRR